MSRTPIHPGEILYDEFRELGMSAAELARCLHVPANRITQILRGQRNITADTALRLGRWFGTDPQLWLSLQQAYELDLARQQAGEEIEQIAPRIPASPNITSEEALAKLPRQRMIANHAFFPQGGELVG